MTTSRVTTKFPAPVYRDTVLAPVFADAKKYFLDPLLEIEYAHTLMLARQGIMPESEALACIRALDDLDRDEVRAVEYDGSFEDLFFILRRSLLRPAVKRSPERCTRRAAGMTSTSRCIAWCCAEG